MPLSRLVIFAGAVALALGAFAPAQAADCNGRQSAGYWVLTLDNGRKVAVWYPAVLTAA